jgi:hypothetical protein
MLPRRRFLGLLAGLAGLQLTPGAHSGIDWATGPDVTVYTVRYTVGDVQFLEAIRVRREEIARIFNVPGRLLLDEGHA